MTKYSITDAYIRLKSLRPVLEKKNGSGREAEHLHEKTHYHRYLDSSLVHSKVSSPQAVVHIEKTEQHPVQKIVDDTGKTGNHQRKRIAKQTLQRTGIHPEAKAQKFRYEEHKTQHTADKDGKYRIGKIRNRRNHTRKQIVRMHGCIPWIPQEQKQIGPRFRKYLYHLERSKTPCTVLLPEFRKEDGRKRVGKQNDTYININIPISGIPHTVSKATAEQDHQHKENGRDSGHCRQGSREYTARLKSFPVGETETPCLQAHRK